MTTDGEGGGAIGLPVGPARDALAQLAAIARASYDAIISKDLDGRITGWNPAAQRLYGYVPQEVIGRHSSVLVHEDFRATEAAQLARAAVGEHVEMAYIRRVHMSGAAVEVSLSLSPIVDEDGVVVGVASASHDVGVLARSDARLKGLLAAAPDAIVCVDTDGFITLINDQVQRLFGYTRAELVGQSVEMLIPNSVRELHPGLRRGYVAHPMSRPMGGGPVQLTAVRKDGSTFPADISLSAVDIDGTLTVTAAVRDGTERLNVLRFRQLAESIDVGFVLCGINPPALLYVSPGFEKIYGYDPTQLNEDPTAVMRRAHPDDWERVAREYWDPASRGLPAQAEFRIVRPDGQVRWVRATTAPVLDADGGVTRSAGTAEDITDRKNVEDALRAAHAEAKQANATKNEFLSRMSHELRTPLNAVLGFAQLLELDDLTAQQQDAVQYILQGGRHLRSLIDDVLDIAKIESDRLDVSLEPVLINELLSETVELMGPQASSMGITLSYRPGVGRYVRADRRRLRQVILNLLSNAIKYNTRGGRVGVTCQPVADSMLDISVKDTGPGIRAEDLHRLFTPFDRLGVKTSEIEGTGVGLALSERLMSTMGGTLGATSQVGAGSLFTASIPLAAPLDVPEIPVEPTASIDHARSPAPTAVQQKTSSIVVYIEDNGSNIELMERLLDRRPEWRLIVAREGGAGLDLVTSCAPDLLLLDLHLPDMNGLDILHRLRADPATADLRVVVLSADGNPNQIKRLMGGGAHGYLTKPLAVAEVLALLDSSVHQPTVT